MHVYIEDLSLKDISTDTLTFKIENIVNPIHEFKCTSETSTQSFYEIKLLSTSSGEIHYSTTPSVDDKNCVEFIKETFAIAVKGPAVLLPGLSYNFTITLEAPGTNLEIYPSANTA